MNIPFFLQERPESCVPACVRMVLAGYGQTYSEADVYACCQTDADGTLPSAVVRCVQGLGLSAHAERLPNIESLVRYVAQAMPVVYLNLAPLLGVSVIHSVVVKAIHVENDRITIIDPSHLPDGQRIWSIGLFQIGWRLAHNQTILISP